MSETSKSNRIKFVKYGVQRDFILKVRTVLRLTEFELAQKLGIHRRTIWEWTQERITMSQNAALNMSRWSGISIPKNHIIVDWQLHYQKAGRIGARKKLEKYGVVCTNEKYRKEKWNEWWKKTGKFKKAAPGFQTLINIKKPRKSKLLAEFIGILLGDGNISDYHVSIILSSEETSYINYVKKTIQKLFSLVPKIIWRKDKKAVNIVINRKLAVDFCQKVGFEKGNKVTHQVDIPAWIKENKIFSRECVRGLVDTDGCFFEHSYLVNGKHYSYLKMAFTSASVPLRDSVGQILINSGFNVRMTKVRENSNGRDIRIDDSKYVTRYIQEIGSHNQKHLDKIEKWKVALNGKAAVC